MRGLLCGLILGLLGFAQYGWAGYDNPSAADFVAAANKKPAVPVAELKKVYACWHVKLGAAHSFTHAQILIAAKGSIAQAYLNGHTGSGEDVAEALRLCRSTN